LDGEKADVDATMRARRTATIDEERMDFMVPSFFMYLYIFYSISKVALYVFCLRKAWGIGCAGRHAVWQTDTENNASCACRRRR